LLQPVVNCTFSEGVDWNIILKQR